MSRKTFAISALAVITVAFATTVVTIWSTQRAKGLRANCQQNLHALDEALHIYLRDYGDYPPTIAAAIKTSDNSWSLAMCPALGNQLDRSKLRIQSDYIYVYWKKNMRLADWGKGHYPLVYDASFANHGDGINILFENGEVTWDENGQRIKKLASDHPELQLPTK